MLPCSIIVADFLEGHRLTLSFEEDLSSVNGLEEGIEDGVVGGGMNRALSFTVWEVANPSLKVTPF